MSATFADGKSVMMWVMLRNVKRVKDNVLKGDLSDKDTWTSVPALLRSRNNVMGWPELPACSKSLAGQPAHFSTLAIATDLS